VNGSLTRRARIGRQASRAAALVFVRVRPLCAGCNIGARNDDLTYSGSDAGWPTSICGGKHHAGD
jgi:hypothetical protein